MTIENKKKKASGYADSILNICSSLIRHLNSVTSVEKICRIRENLLFILRMLNAAGNEFGVTPSNMYRISDVYVSNSDVTPKMRRNELSNIIYDLYTVSERFMFFVRWTNDVQYLNQIMRILYTFDMYLSAVRKCNPEFWPNRKKPQYLWKTKSPFWDNDS